MVDSLAEVSASRVTARHPECGSMGNFAGRSAARVMENTQRDLNIAFINEFSAICHGRLVRTSKRVFLCRPQSNKDVSGSDNR
jgi:hypothetical protein